MNGKQYYVYIATNKWGTAFYTGITNNIHRRMYEHQQKLILGFTSRYHIDRLVFCGSFNTPEEAIEAEKKIKGWTRKRKIELIKQNNPEWMDLLADV